MTKQVADFLLQNANEVSQAALFDNTTQRPFHFQQIVIPLDTAQSRNSSPPFKIGFPFKSIAVVSSTDSATNVDIKIGGQDEQNPWVNIGKNTTITFEEPQAEAYVSWTAQTGKSITLLLAIDAKLDFSTVSIAITGGIFQQDGTAVAPIASVTMVAATAIIIAPVLSTRKSCNLVNNTGGVVYCGGDNTVTADTTATGGIPIAPGGQLTWRNTSALWAISAAGGLVNRLEES